MRRRYNLAKSDNFPVTSVAVISDTIVLEDENLSVVFEPTKPSLVTKINLNFSRGDWLSDITATAEINKYPTINLCSKIDSADKTEWLLTPQAPLYIVPGDKISIFAKIADSMGNSSSTSSVNSSSSSESSSSSINSSSSTSLSSITSSSSLSSANSSSSVSSKSSESSESSKSSVNSSSSISSSSSVSSVNSSSSLSSSSSVSSGLSSGMTSSSWSSDPDVFSYVIDVDEVVITGYLGRGGNITIPSVIEGLPVTRIGSYAFKDSLINSIVIPSSVKIIKHHAFMNCKLTSVTFNEGLQLLEDSAFWLCSNLEHIKLPDSLIDLGQNVFSGCDALTTFDTGDGLEVFQELSGLPLLSNVRLGENIKVIDDYAFSSDYSLTSLKIPRSVTTLGAYLFESELTDVTFIGDAPTSVDPNAFHNFFMGTIKYCESASGWTNPFYGAATVSVNCDSILSSSGSSLESSSSVSSTGDFRVTYEIHYIPLYQLSQSESEALGVPVSPPIHILPI